MMPKRLNPIFIWNEWNVEHIAAHGVHPDEARSIIENARPPFPRQIERGKHLVWGQALSGRYLQVIFVYLDDDEVDFHSLPPADRLSFSEGTGQPVYVIHARDLTAKQKRRFRSH